MLYNINPVILLSLFFFVLTIHLLNPTWFVTIYVFKVSTIKCNQGSKPKHCFITFLDCKSTQDIGTICKNKTITIAFPVGKIICEVYKKTTTIEWCLCTSLKHVACKGIYTHE